MTGLDIAVLLVVGLAAITGFFRGFVQEMASLAAWIFALFAIRYMHGPMTAWLEPKIGTPSGASVLAFAILLLIPYAFVKLIAGRMGEATRNSVLGPIDRLLGFGFGSVKGFIIAIMAFSILCLGYDTVWGAGGRPSWITQARTYSFLNAGSEELVTMIAARRAEATAAEHSALEKK